MYKVTTKTYLNKEYLEIIRTNQDGSATSIPEDSANTDYQEYLKWVAEGNVPTPADE
jgi:hypothetical protein